MSEHSLSSDKSDVSDDDHAATDGSGPDDSERASTAGDLGIGEGGESLRCFPRPVTHGAGISYNLADTSLYDQARELWQSEVGEPENEPLFIDYTPDFIEEERANSDGFGLRFKSEGWKAGMETGTNGYRQWYKYRLNLRERVTENGRTKWKDPLGISLDILIHPQVDGLVYPDGNDLDLPYGEGTYILCQTTYPDGPEEMVDRTTNALSAVLDYDKSSYIPESARITKLEKHVRFDIEAKNRAVECLETSKRLIDYGGSAELKGWQERTRAGWVEARVDTDRWDLLGFDSTGFSESLKVYQIGDWAERVEDDPLHHTKLEAGYQGGDGVHPPLSAWEKLSERLAHNVVQHCRWAGIESADLVADPHYLGSGAPVKEYPVLDGRREDLRAYYDGFEKSVFAEVWNKKTRGPFDILSVVLEYSGADYDTLVSETGLSRSTVRYHVARFEELGFVERVGNPTWVFFEAPYVGDIVREIVEEWEPDTVARKRIERKKRADERQAKREGEPSDADESGAEDDEQAARALFRYIEEVGITADQLSELIAEGELTERDVRVRWSEELEDAIG